MAHLRLATRGSEQARTQTLAVVRELESVGHTAELVIVDTYGDRAQASNVPLHSIGGQGVFTKEIQTAVLDGRADAAVHSAKDLPTYPVEGLDIAAVTSRRDPADALIGRSLDDLTVGATVATGSVRRRAQLQQVRPDLVFVELRGNIGTRLQRVPDNGAIVMAVAALEVLDRTDVIAQRLDVADFVPAVGQGCVAIECAPTDADVADALASIDDATARRAVTIERAFLNEMGAGCSQPVGAHVAGDTLHVFVGRDHGGAAVCRSVALTSTAGGDLTSDCAVARSTARDALASTSGT